MNLHMERRQPEEISESLILKESEFCVRKSSMLCFQKHYKFLTSTLCNIEKKTGKKSRKFNCCLQINPMY